MYPAAEHSIEHSVEPKKRKPTEGEIGSKRFKTDCEDNKFETFQNICSKVANVSSHLKKSSIIREFFNKGINKGNFSFSLL